MNINKDKIPHYREEMIPISTLKKIVNLNEKYLREKPTWYEIDHEVKYFKVRDDFRLFTELFTSELGSILGLKTLKYTLAYVRTKEPGIPSSKEKTKLGLLSNNFQTKDYNYYLASELMDSEISDLKSYNGYSFESLLKFFKDTLAEEDYKKVKEFLIRLFVIDAFTMQLDRNPNNIGFQIPKIENLSYKKRLRQKFIKETPHSHKYLTVEKGDYKLKGFEPSVIYDNERILGVDHKKVFLYKKGDVWMPLFPFHESLLFESMENAKKSYQSYGGFDPNLVELYVNYPEATPYIERLAYGDEYKKILEEFTKNTDQISLTPDTKEYFDDMLNDRRKEFQKVLKF